MNKQEAYKIAVMELESYEDLPYRELKLMVGENITKTTTSASGVKYQIDTQLLWDDKNQTNIKVMVSVDDMGWFVFSPITESILVKAAQ